VPETSLDMIVRDARPDDAAGVAAVLNAIIAAGEPVAFDAPLTAEAERLYIAEFPERGVFHVAVRQDDGVIVGFQSLEPFAASIHAFDHVGVIGTYVAGDCRRRGVARCLFAATFEAARRQGFEKIFTYIRADNPTALAAYASQGFEVVGRARRQARFGDRYVDEVFVERFL